MNYKNTLNLPKTDFSMQARLPQNEPRILDFWTKLDIYNLLKEKSKKRPKFILHDGPPYANGDIHIGHALNKILKDFVVKYKIMQGYHVPFVPGWDCHGLPVEHQLFKELKITKHQIDKVEFRKKARDFALKFVNIQMEQFIRLGLVADWQRPYLTLDFEYEAEIVRAFGKLAKDGYIYRGFKPINWCINCETALAEAEVEYADHRSRSIYVKFKLVNEKKINNLPSEQLQNTYFLIWTTTPWTLVSNVAIAAHPDFAYSLVEVSRQGSNKETLILAKDLVEIVMLQAGIKDYKITAKIKGAQLKNLQAEHPFLKRRSRLVLANYVSEQEGTGFVHIAPGHGQEDYLTGLEYKLPVIMPVTENGKFDAQAAEFAEMEVFQANSPIIERMKEKKTLLYASEILHSYPHCWRCKKPLITRSTKQWFINVEHKNLRQRSLKAIKSVQWIPQTGESRISSMVEIRPDWCLSRQRFWGVPIPVFYCKSCGKEIIRPNIINKIADKFAKEGSDIWFTESTDELLGKKLECPSCKERQLSKEQDIIDVWFDSGISHQAVLMKNAQLAFPASLYLEGSDQHRGWFQTALLTSVPLARKAPYLMVLTHGFVMDGEGKKMSKSRGNVISPLEVISQYGAEVLRLWVASCDYSDDVRISPQILASTADAYRKIRNTFRFLLGNLYDFLPEDKVKYNRLQEIDKWALSALTRLLMEATDDFEHFRYYRLFRRLYNFCVQKMSSFYLDILKDRLYTSSHDSLTRRSAQTVLCEILTSLTKVCAPILSFTAEEVWNYLAKILQAKEKQTVFLNRWPKIEKKWLDGQLDKKMERLIKIRNAVLKAIENEREKGRIHSSLEARVRLFAIDEELHHLLNDNLELLVCIFIVSDVSVNKVDSLSKDVLISFEIPHLGIKVEKIEFPKCQRCWNFRDSVGKNNKHPLLCHKCIEVIGRVNR